ncbi:hypothetical protein AAGW05_08655 [Arthrobacter sp. LAPM80]|uniref:hypothetical protein n=1 Tax=Arthrobacter sp. LAPM80 TaxID=3141788 RepID=UPI00398B0085
MLNPVTMSIITNTFTDRKERARAVDPRAVHRPALFHSVPFTSATLTAVLAFFSWGAFLFINALYLQEVRGLCPLHTGLYMLPMALSTLVFSLLSGRRVGRLYTRPSLVSATLLIAASGASMTFLDAHTSSAALFASYILLGPPTSCLVWACPNEPAGRHFPWRGTGRDGDRGRRGACHYGVVRARHRPPVADRDRLLAGDCCPGDRVHHRMGPGKRGADQWTLGGTTGRPPLN